MVMKLQISISKVDSSHTCLDTALKKDDNYYPQVFFKYCK